MLKLIVLAPWVVAACVTNVEARRDTLPSSGNALVLVVATIQVDHFDVRWSDALLAKNRVSVVVRRDDGAEFAGAVPSDGILALELPPGDYRVVRLDKLDYHGYLHDPVDLGSALGFRVERDDRVVYGGSLFVDLYVLRAEVVTADCFGVNMRYIRGRLPALPWDSLTVVQGVRSMTDACPLEPPQRAESTP